MCGRFVQLPLQFPDRTPWPELADDLANLTARYNLAPTQRAAVVLDADGQKRVLRLRWGLIPPWSKDLKGSYSTINARIETVSTKPAYRAAYKARRCVVPMAGYYEWTDTASGKQPWYIHLRDGGDLFAAAIWEPHHRLQEEGEDGSCSIITSDARDAAGQVHDRMPVFLPPDRIDEFMAASPEDAMALLLGMEVPDVVVEPVSQRVNSSRNNPGDPGMLEPIALG
jgi:putative SOS response-associated peptidase YedK